jgi:ribonuclease HI
MLVTIYTDGGLSPVKGQAYAYYCRSYRGVVKAAVFIKHHFDTAEQVEAYAAFKGVEAAVMHWPEVSKIIINTDNIGVVDKLNDNVSPHGKRTIKIIKATKKLVNPGVIIEARHVKGHQRSDNVRSYLNNWCDKALNKIRDYYYKRKND